MHLQNVDATFCIFIWAVIVQQPGMHISIVPPKVFTEVYIALQLAELELIVKHRHPRISTNLCMHKNFFEHSLVWRQVIEETCMQAKDMGGTDEFEQALKYAAPVQHVMKLLQNLLHHMYTSQDLLIKIVHAMADVSVLLI
ncbi:hypothetical protein A0H81_02823 [Grifola frondosa]|uniref:Uncharacterized protein n=1 Tax=Grifola frondosa TaxID=5627 RepID=A0A1C7MJX6_GRIFR|nr:hypothetical protein A0H81_02823 [Grifola frondosa]